MATRKELRRRRREVREKRKPVTHYNLERREEEALFDVVFLQWFVPASPSEQKRRKGASFLSSQSHYTISIVSLLSLARVRPYLSFLFLSAKRVKSSQLLRFASSTRPLTKRLTLRCINCTYRADFLPDFVASGLLLKTEGEVEVVAFRPDDQRFLLLLVRRVRLNLGFH